MTTAEKERTAQRAEVQFGGLSAKKGLRLAGAVIIGIIAMAVLYQVAHYLIVAAIVLLGFTFPKW